VKFTVTAVRLKVLIVSLEKWRVILTHIYVSRSPAEEATQIGGLKSKIQLEI
jgi:hypothetical protein